MSWKHLGETFDIHGGGIDLVFPHHENEIAQSRCAFGHSVMANVWMHNGFLQVEGEKMSKSLGNFVTIHELLASDKFGGKAWSGDVLRLAMLGTQYRQPIDWTVTKLRQARAALSKFKRWYVPIEKDHYVDFDPLKPNDRLILALCDDLNTPSAITVLHELVAELEEVESQKTPDHNRRLSEFSRSLELLGLVLEAEALSVVDAEKVEALINLRLQARNQKDWSESDRIRDELLAMGIQIKDGKDADGKLLTTWEVKR